MRYIDADVLHKAYMELRNFKQDPQSGDWISLRAVPLTTVIRMLNDAPSIDIEPKRGEWIFKTVFPNDKSEFPMGYLVCSVCGSHHSNSTPCNYCDNCGADMREVRDE